MEKNITNTKTRRTKLEVLDSRRAELSKGLQTYKQFLDVIPVNKQEKFKENFLELATQDYLLSIVDTKEIIRFCVNVTKIGLDIAPSAKEVYIIPFDTKINGQKVMLPQSIIPLNGMQQLAYQKGFFLEIDAVYKFDDNTCESASKLSRLQQCQLNTANEKWVDSHFIGYDVIITDLKKELPTQTKFVDRNYLIEATKTIKDSRWKLQTWRHKAVRRAYGDFMIPRDRKIEAFEEIEHLNDSILNMADSNNAVLTNEIEDALNQLGIKLLKNNGVAVATNVQLTHYKTLKDYGFKNENNQWVIAYEDIEDVEVTPSKSNQDKNEMSPAKKLFVLLTDKGFSNEEIGEFVGDFLELSKDDTNGINEYLENQEKLDEKLQHYTAMKNGENNMDIPSDLF